MAVNAVQTARTRSFILVSLRHGLDLGDIDAYRFGEARPALRVGHVEVAHHLHLDLVALHLLQIASQILDQMAAILLVVGEVEIARLREVVLLGDGTLHRLAIDRTRGVAVRWRFLERYCVRLARFIVDIGLGSSRGESSELVACVYRSERAVDGKLLEVAAYTMPLRVEVREQPALQQAVFGSLNAGHQVTGREGRLLGLFEEVGG